MTLSQQSELFHSFEWLRSEALNGNRHAEVMVIEVIRLNKGAIKSPTEPFTPTPDDIAAARKIIEQGSL